MMDQATFNSNNSYQSHVNNNLLLNVINNNVMSEQSDENVVDSVSRSRKADSYREKLCRSLRHETSVVGWNVFMSYTQKKSIRRKNVKSMFGFFI